VNRGIWRGIIFGLLVAGNLPAQNTTDGGGNTTAKAPDLPPLAEAVTLSVEGNSLMTGDAISGNWTGLGPVFSATMKTEKKNKVRMRFIGSIELENGRYRLVFNLSETAPAPFKTADGKTINGVTSDGFTDAVLLTMDEPMQVLDGSGANLTLKLTKAAETVTPTTAKSGPRLLAAPGLPENVSLKVQAELLKGSPFEIALTGASGMMTLHTLVPVPDGVPYKRASAYVSAKLTPAAEGYRLDYNVVMTVLVPSGSNTDGPLYRHEPLGGASTTYLTPGVPMKALESNLGNLTFTLAESNGNTTAGK